MVECVFFLGRLGRSVSRSRELKQDPQRHFPGGRWPCLGNQPEKPRQTSLKCSLFFVFSHFAHGHRGSQKARQKSRRRFSNQRNKDGKRDGRIKRDEMAHSPTRHQSGKGFLDGIICFTKPPPLLSRPLANRTMARRLRAAVSGVFFTRGLCPDARNRGAALLRVLWI